MCSTCDYFNVDIKCSSYKSVISFVEGLVLNKNIYQELCLHQGFLRWFRDPIWVPENENRVPRIRENYV